MRHTEQLPTTAPTAEKCSAILQVLTSVSDLSKKVVELAENEPDLQLKSDLYQFVCHIHRETLLLIAKAETPGEFRPILKPRDAHRDSYWSADLWSRLHGYTPPTKAQLKALDRRCIALSQMLHIKHTTGTVPCFKPDILSVVLPVN